MKEGQSIRMSGLATNLLFGRFDKVRPPEWFSVNSSTKGYSPGLATNLLFGRFDKVRPPESTPNTEIRQRKTIDQIGRKVQDTQNNGHLSYIKKLTFEFLQDQ
jgi:hypothetical protein